MKRMFLPAVFAFASLMPSPPVDADESPKRPPLPSPATPPPTALTPMPTAATPPAPGRPSPSAAIPAATGAARPQAARKKPPTIRLGEKHQTDEPHQKGAGIILPAKFQVKADRARLTAVLAGALQSNSFFGLPSDCVSTIQLVQEFEVVPGDPADPRVMLALSAKLEGYVRGDKRGTAALRRADAAVSPADGGPTSWVAFAPVVNPPDSEFLHRQEQHAPPLSLAAGRYVLVATLVLEATAECPFRDRGVAVFAPPDPKSVWIFQEDNPFEDANDEDFGLAIVLRTAAPPSD